MLLRCIRLERSQCDQRYSTGAGQKESNGLEAFKGVEEVLAETKDVRLRAHLFESSFFGAPHITHIASET